MMFTVICQIRSHVWSRWNIRRRKCCLNGMVFVRCSNGGKVLPQMLGVLQTPGVLFLCFLPSNGLKPSPICGGFECCASFFFYLNENIYDNLDVNNARLVDSTPYHSYNKRLSFHLLHYQC